MTVGLLELALLAVGTVIAVQMLNPDTHDAMVEGISDGIDSILNSIKGKQTLPKQEQLDSIARSSYTSGDNNLGPGYGYKPPKCGFFCWLGIGTGVGFLACVLTFEEKCVNAASNPISEPTLSTNNSTLTPTMTPSPISTPPPTQTMTPTITSTSTPTHALIPPAITPTPPRREDRLLIPI